MSTTSRLNIKAVTKLIDEYPSFSTFTPAKQAAFRARLSRFIKLADQVGERDILNILIKIQDDVGKIAPTRKATMTVSGLTAEFRSDWDTMTNAQRGAFKAKAARLRGRLEKSGDMSGVTKVKKLLADIVMIEQAADKARLFSLAKSAGLFNQEDSES